MFSCEFYEIFKNNFFLRAPPVATSVQLYLIWMNSSVPHRFLLLISEQLLCGTVAFQTNPFKLTIRLAIFWNSYFSEELLFRTAIIYSNYLQEQPPKVFYKNATLLKGDSNTGVFLWILQNFWEELFWRTSANGCFCP